MTISAARWGMYEIAAQVAQWLAEGRGCSVAQVVATQGFSSREPAAALAWTATATRSVRSSRSSMARVRARRSSD